MKNITSLSGDHLFLRVDITDLRSYRGQGLIYLFLLKIVTQYWSALIYKVEPDGASPVTSEIAITCQLINHHFGIVAMQCGG